MTNSGSWAPGDWTADVTPAPLQRSRVSRRQPDPPDPGSSSSFANVGAALESARRHLAGIAKSISRLARSRRPWNSDLDCGRDIPHHILVRIAEYLYHPDDDSPSDDLLPGMALVCRSWGAAAMEHLVRDLFIMGSSKQVWKMVESLSGYRVKAPWNREGLQIGALDSLFEEGGSDTSSLAGSVTEPSPNSPAPLHTVKALDFTEVPNLDSEVLPLLLPYIRPRALRTFRIASSRFVHESHVRAFLAETPELRDLGLVGLHCTNDIDFARFVVDSCPRIKYLDWVAPDPAFHGFLVPGPADYILPLAELPLECLNLQDHPDLDDEIFFRLMDQAAWDLRALGLAGAGLTNAGLELLCNKVPNLEDLDLTFLGGDNLYAITSDIFEKILSMPKLRRLDMSCTGLTLNNRAIQLLRKSKLEYFGWEELPLFIRGKRKRQEFLENAFMDRFGKGQLGLQWGGNKGWSLVPTEIEGEEDGVDYDDYYVGEDDDEDDDFNEDEDDGGSDEDEEDGWSTEDEEDEDGWSTENEVVQQYNAM